MNNHLILDKAIEEDLKANNLVIEEDSSIEELERIFNLDHEETKMVDDIKQSAEKYGPNFYLVGGPYKNYNKSL